MGTIVTAMVAMDAKEKALWDAAPELLQTLKAAKGYMLNAKIDLETGAPKKTAIQTIEGGINLVSAAITKATGSSNTSSG